MARLTEKPRSRWYQDSEVYDLITHLSAEERYDNWDALGDGELRAIEKEIERCRKDFVYAARNYFWVIDDNGNEQQFCLWPSQEIIYDTMMGIKKQGKSQKLIIIKSRRLGCCLDPDTKVLTSDLRWIRIDDATPGMELVSVDEYGPEVRGHQRKLRRGIVLAKEEVYEPAYKLTMESGECLIATGQHRFMSRRRSGTEAIWRYVNHRPKFQHTLACIQPGDEIRFITLNGEWWEGKTLPKNMDGGSSWHKVVSVEELGPRRMVDLQTSTKTYIANGYVSHNSTLIEALVAWSTIFFSNRIGIVVSYDRMHTKNLLEIMLKIYDKLPWWMKPRVMSRTLEGGLKFDNPDHEMRGVDPGTQSQVMLKSGNAVTGVAQGYRISCAHVSEFADMEDHCAREIIEEDLTPAIQQDASAFGFLESTAKGANRFAHRLWKRCEELAENSEWYPLFLPWFVDKTHVYQSHHNQQFDGELVTMRERIKDEWVRCDNQGCERYFNRWRVRVDQSGSRCPDCQIGTLNILELSNDQLAWMQRKKLNAKDDEESVKRLKQEQACVVGGSRVSTDRGIIRIDQAELAYKTETGQISKWYKYTDRETLVINTHLGRTMQCTTDQGILTQGGEFVRSEHLVPGDKIVLSPPIFRENEYEANWHYSPSCLMSIVIDKDWGRFIGYFMGDGSWGKDCVQITCDKKDQDVVEDICSLLEKLIGRKPLVTYVGGMTVVRSASVLWRKIMLGLGLIEQWHTCTGWKRKVHVPECIWRSPRHVVKEFLSALIECDGHAYRDSPKTVFFTKWDQFARDVQLLLLGFGINSHISSERKVNGDGRVYKGNNLQMKSVASNVFHREIGFISNRKITTACVREPQRSFAFKNEMIDIVASVSDGGKRDVYDFTVPSVHCFGCNGIMIHNSTAEEAFQVTGYQVFGQAAQDFANSEVRKPIITGLFDQRGRVHAVDTKSVRFDQNGNPIPSTIKCLVDGCKENHYFDDCPLRIWELPSDTARYYIGADVSEGLGGNCDYSVGSVIRMSGGSGIGPTYQVAAWRSNKTSPQDFAEQLNYLGHMYNLAEISVEVNKFDTANTWLRLNCQYPNLYRWKLMDSVNPITNKIGWYTNQLSRPRLHQNFRRFLEYKMFYVRSSVTANEMKNFVKDDYDDRTAGADSDTHDDELIATMISLWCAYEGMVDETRGFVPLNRDASAEVSEYKFNCQACGLVWYGDAAMIPQMADYTGLRADGLTDQLRCRNDKCKSNRVTFTQNRVIRTRNPQEHIEDSEIFPNTGNERLEYWSL